ncbi:hypothetical protein J8273_2044 [Carpediemonas membranifera]|uniref:Uncharacterized protein n=1 Tax=Carpediemonas membranifera TaxID=201153 RepID=A0A8J6AX32_9EUKA|nr:hypothetical protein J8273_2044 [Carpediemonas membranifera]|eukprot:KAG9396313.1 hypothetical protein J8273_2044 [Carpediemonas membranifera]
MESKTVPTLQPHNDELPMNPHTPVSCVDEFLTRCMTRANVIEEEIEHTVAEVRRIRESVDTFTGLTPDWQEKVANLLQTARKLELDLHHERLRSLEQFSTDIHSALSMDDIAMAAAGCSDSDEPSPPRTQHRRGTGSQTYLGSSSEGGLRRMASKGLLKIVGLDKQDGDLTMKKLTDARIQARLDLKALKEKHATKEIQAQIEVCMQRLRNLDTQITAKLDR